MAAPRAITATEVAAQVAKPVGQIQDSLTALHNEINSLGVAVDSIVERLDPVLGPTYPSNETDKAPDPEPVRCSIAESAAQAAKAISLISARIRYLESRVQL